MSTKGKILLIDDEPQLLQSMELFLGDEFEIVHANGGETGIAMAHDCKPDIILLDVGLPDIDGFEVCRRIKSDVVLKFVPIIFLTAYGSVADEMTGLKVGAVDYISKPFNEQIVKARVCAHFALKQQHDELRTLVRLDDLTKISNRRHFDEMLRIEWRRAYRYQSSLSVVMIDIDSFKKFNDGYGHIAGDECLKKVAQYLRQTVSRSADIMARYGGEEFVALLPNTSQDALHAVGERLRSVVESANIRHEHSSTHHSVTVSIGAASIVPTADAQLINLVERADRAMYVSKRLGGNRVSVDFLDDQECAALAS